MTMQKNKSWQSKKWTILEKASKTHVAMHVPIAKQTST